jgi:multidrug efflux system membrane fusion protein
LGTEEGFPHAGILDFADNKVDRSTGTLRVRGLFQNDSGILSPGLFVRVRIPFGVPHQALLVTDRAIGTDQRQKYLTIVNASKDNVVEHRPVKVGRLLDGMRVIESGVQPEDLVVVKGLLRARPGVKVKPIMAEPAVAASAKAAESDKPADSAKTTTN